MYLWQNIDYYYYISRELDSVSSGSKIQTFRWYDEKRGSENKKNVAKIFYKYTCEEFTN